MVGALLHLFWDSPSPQQEAIFLFLLRLVGVGEKQRMGNHAKFCSRWNGYLLGSMANAHNGTYGRDAHHGVAASGKIRVCGR